MMTAPASRRGRWARVTRNPPDSSSAPGEGGKFDMRERLEFKTAPALPGAGGAFCAGADLKALAAGETRQVEPESDFGPMGPTRLALGKPVIAAVEGPAVAGGMELALWCDLRIAGRSAYFGLYNRRFGVP